jgi:lantibiotic modifying enzyme
LDGHFKELLTWVNAKREGGTPAFCTMNIVDGGDHGWCEFIAPRSCGTVAEVERFYWRQGGYLAILYALEASDFHSENLIARGEDPMLVDLEALFHPRTLEFEKLSAQDPTRTAWLNSVCRVGLLPQRENGTEEHEGHDVSGLGDRPGNCRCDSHG